MYLHRPKTYLNISFLLCIYDKGKHANT